MTVAIKIIYKSAVSGCKILQGASFQLKGRQLMEVALNWFREIQREMNVGSLEQVLCNGEDITEIIKEMDKK